jgi:hypothetical protein
LVTEKYWTFEARRRFFDDLAKTHGFDPLIAKNWYSVPYKAIENEKVPFLIPFFPLPTVIYSPFEIILLLQKGEVVIRYHKGSYVQAIMDLYPDIGLDRSKFGRASYIKVS